MNARNLLVTIVALVALGAGAVTVHRSFRNGYPAEADGAAARKVQGKAVLSAPKVTKQAKTSTPLGWTDDYEAALKRAAAEKKLIVADFSGSDWCGWCKRLDKEVFDTEVFRKGATNRYVLLMIDTPRDQSILSEKAKSQNPVLLEKYAIRGFPTVLMLDKDGRVVHRTGYQRGGPAPYLEMLKAAEK